MALAALGFWVGGRREIQTCRYFFATHCNLLLSVDDSVLVKASRSHVPTPFPCSTFFLRQKVSEGSDNVIFKKKSRLQNELISFQC